MRDTISAIVIVFALVAGSLGLGWVFAANDTQMRATFAPINTSIDNQVFHNSQQYTDGMSQELDQARQTFANPNTTEAQKDAMRSAIMHDFASFDTRYLPPDQQAFLTQLRGY